MSLASDIPRDEIARERINRYMIELTEKAPTSLAAHAALLHRTESGRPMIPAKHHLEWCRILEDRENYRWVTIVAPPGYAKSSWISQAYAAWRIGQTKGKIRMGIVSNTASLTYGIARSIQKTIEDSHYKHVYGVEPNKSRGWSQAKFWTTGSDDAKNPTVMAAGIGGPIQGMRYDEIILDDPTTWDDARSDLTMAGQRHFLKALLLQRFPPGMGPPDGDGRMVVVLTRWSESDLVPTLETVGFKTVTMPALGYWDRKQTGPNEWEYGEEPLWPEKENREALMKERDEDGPIFELVKQGNAQALGGDVFDPAWFQYGRPPKKGELQQIIQYIDTASGKDREKGDYFAEATIGLQNDGEKVWILDMDRGYYAAPEQERAVTRNYEKITMVYGEPDQVCIEDVNEGTALYQRMIVNSRLPLRAIRPVKDKEFRAIPISNAYRAGRVWHPARKEGDHWVPERWVRPFEGELAAFPRGVHDDQVDAVASAYAETTGTGPRLRVLSGQSSNRRFR